MFGQVHVTDYLSTTRQTGCSEDSGIALVRSSDQFYYLETWQIIYYCNHLLRGSINKYLCSCFC